MRRRAQEAFRFRRKMDLATPPIRIGMRGSVLALAQANWVKRRIEQRCPEASVEIGVIRTGGDRFSEAPMQILRGKGVFTKEIEDALLAYENRCCSSLDEGFAG